MTTALIHLSDFHNVKGKHENHAVLVNALFEDLQQQVAQVNADQIYLVFSGDIVQSADKVEQYEDFYDAFDARLKSIGIEKKHRICVPGNHDMSRAMVEKNFVEHEGVVSQKLTEQQFNDYVLKRPNVLAEKFNSYLSFQDRFSKFGITEEEVTGRGFELSEDIGILQVIIQATHYILHDHESANRWSINTSIHGNVEEKPIRRKIFVNVFPERELADLMYRYRQFCCGLPRETILEMVALDRIGKENIPRRFDSLRSHIDTYDYNYLCSGKLRGDLEVVLEKHSGK